MTNSVTTVCNCKNPSSLKIGKLRNQHIIISTRPQIINYKYNLHIIKSTIKKCEHILQVKGRILHLFCMEQQIYNVPLQFHLSRIIRDCAES